jgi:hypothetical protein
MPMKIKVAVLEKMGVRTPCEKSKPLAIQEVKLVPPGRGGPNESRGSSCHSGLSVISGNQPPISVISPPRKPRNWPRSSSSPASSRNNHPNPDVRIRSDPHEKYAVLAMIS